MEKLGLGESIMKRLVEIELMPLQIDEGCSKVGKTMKERNMKKIIGYMLIELHGMVHEFWKREKSQPKNKRDGHDAR